LVKSQEGATHAKDNVTIDVDDNDRLFVRSQVTDYQLRGDDLEDVNVLDFFVDTYEEDVKRTRRSQEVDVEVEDNIEALDADIDGEQSRGPTGSKRGRPRHNRSQYKEGHPQRAQKQRVMRQDGHRNLPNFVGPYLPRRDDPDIRELYCASMLTLLKPWRILKTDLKGDDETWEDAFDKFIHTDYDRFSRTTSNVQYYHQCQTAAARDTGDKPAPDAERFQDEMAMDEEANEFDLGEGFLDSNEDMTEEGLQEVIDSQTSVQEYMHGRMAVETAKYRGVFGDDEGGWNVQASRRPANATGGDIQMLQDWKDQMREDVQRLNANVTGTIEQGDAGGVQRLDGEAQGDNGEVTTLGPEEAIEGVELSKLKEDQRRAYDIITWHLQQTLAGKNPPPLRMVLSGEGGTGKSRVIQTVTDAFKAAGAAHLLVKAAYTGV
jgi:hypothetical protein